MDNDPVSLLVRRFDRALRKVEQGQKKFIPGRKTAAEPDKGSKKADVKCYGCKGYESDSEDELNNFVAFLGITDFESGSESDAEPERELDESYKKREAKLAKESVGLIKEKLILAKQVEELIEEVVAERKVSEDLQAKLDQHNKNIRMLTGTKQLDKILCAGRTENSHMGLGYTGRQYGDTGKTNFVSGGYAHAEELSSKTIVHQTSGCFFCGKFNHYKKFCYLKWVKQVWKQHKFWRIEKTNQVWMKTDMYSRTVNNGVCGVRCNMARVTDDSDSDEPWYFDSGCSRHMTGNAEYLEEVSKVKGGKESGEATIVTCGKRRSNACLLKGMRNYGTNDWDI
ncbi:hypothetical protein YC2023_065229 [Brassica napus]